MAPGGSGGLGSASIIASAALTRAGRTSNADFSSPPPTFRMSPLSRDATKRSPLLSTNDATMEWPPSKWVSMVFWVCETVTT